MANTSPQHPAEQYIEPLNINGLEGRMLHLPAPKNKKYELLFVYGHHSNLERWWGLMQVLNRYAAVTMPDLPGFGGMDSFYSIGQKPTIDNLADYLAAFMKLRYKRKKVIIVGMSFGFVIVTRMLQRYPELTKKVVVLGSIVGFSHKDDFSLARWRYWFYRGGTRFFSWRLPALLYRYVGLRPALLRRAYAKSYNARDKFHNISAEEFDTTMEMEIKLWRQNHVRTHFFTNNQLLRVDNCTMRLDLPVWHVATSKDVYFDQRIVEQHLKVVFKNVYTAQVKHAAHAPTVIADAKSAEPFVPLKFRRKLASLK